MKTINDIKQYTQKPAVRYLSFIVISSIIMIGAIIAINSTTPVIPTDPINPEDPIIPTDPTSPEASEFKITDRYLISLDQPGKDGSSWQSAYILPRLSYDYLSFHMVSKYVIVENYHINGSFCQWFKGLLGVKIFGSAHILFRNVTITGVSGKAISIEESTDLTFEGLQIQNVEKGIEIFKSKNINITRSSFTAVNFAIDLVNSTQIEISQNFYNMTAGKLIQSDSKSWNVNFYHNLIRGGEIDCANINSPIGLSGQIGNHTVGNIYFDTYNLHDYTTLIPITELQSIFAQYIGLSYPFASSDIFTGTGFIDLAPVYILSPFTSDVIFDSLTILTDYHSPNLLLNSSKTIMGFDRVKLSIGNYQEFYYPEMYPYTATINDSYWTSLMDGVIEIGYEFQNFFNRTITGNFFVDKDTQAPVLTLIEPIPEIITRQSPRIVFLSEDTHLDSQQYRINTEEWMNCSNIIQINASVWNLLPEGMNNITIIVNDTLGHESTLNFSIIKDTTLPIINIISPINHSIYGLLSPVIELTINELHLKSVSYRINNGPIAYPFSIGAYINESIDAGAWFYVPQGNSSITIYAEDIVGNIASVSISIERDVTPPFIDILNIEDFQLVASFPPFIEISVYDRFLDSVWYRINLGTNISAASTGFTIEYAPWTEAYNGIVILDIFALDIWGNLVQKTHYLMKDTLTPFTEFNFVNPNNQPLLPYFNAPFGLNYSVYDLSLHRISYSVDGSDQIHLIGPFVGYQVNPKEGQFMINSSIFEELEDGLHLITLFAFDRAGYSKQISLQFKIDRKAPILSVNNPDLGYINATSASATIYILEDYLVELWGQVYTGSEWRSFSISTFPGNYSNVSYSFLIERSVFASCPEGFHAIQIWGKDAVGQTSFVNLTFIRDSIAPRFMVIQPNITISDYRTPPMYIFVIIESSPILNMYYRINGELFAIDSNSGFINELAWLRSINYTISLEFMAVDAAGNWGSAMITIQLEPETDESSEIIPETFKSTRWVLIGCAAILSVGLGYLIKTIRRKQ